MLASVKCPTRVRTTAATGRRIDNTRNIPVIKGRRRDCIDEVRSSRDVACSHQAMAEPTRAPDAHGQTAAAWIAECRRRSTRSDPMSLSRPTSRWVGSHGGRAPPFAAYVRVRARRPRAHPGHNLAVSCCRPPRAGCTRLCTHLTSSCLNMCTSVYTTSHYIQ